MCHRYRIFFPFFRVFHNGLRRPAKTSYCWGEYLNTMSFRLQFLRSHLFRSRLQNSFVVALIIGRWIMYIFVKLFFIVAFIKSAHFDLNTERNNSVLQSSSPSSTWNDWMNAIMNCDIFLFPLQISWFSRDLIFRKMCDKFVSFHFRDSANREKRGCVSCGRRERETKSGEKKSQEKGVAFLSVWICVFMW